MSELAGTITSNIALLRQHRSNITEVPLINELTASLNPLATLLQPLHKDSLAPPTKNNVLGVLRFFVADNDQLDNVIDDAFQVGNAMFSIAANYIVTRTLLRNPEEYANLIKAADNSDTQFRCQKDTRAMRDFLLAQCLPQGRADQGHRTCRRQMLQELLTDSDHESQTETSSNSSSSSTSDEDEDEDSQVKTVTKRLRDKPETSKTNTLPPAKPSSKPTKKRSANFTRKRKPTATTTSKEPDDDVDACSTCNRPKKRKKIK